MKGWRTWHCAEWRPRDAAAHSGGQQGVAIGELMVSPLQMHSVNQLLFAAVIGCAVICGGCATRRAASDAPSLWHNSAFHPVMPAVPFGSYKAAFRYIAKCEGLPSDSSTLFALAADSTLERSHSHLAGDLVIVRAEYYGQSRFGIRGAQGQGRYYVFQTRDDGWRLVGILHGNSYRWDAVGDTLRIITRTHLSAVESPETIYTWTGQLFE